MTKILSCDLYDYMEIACMYAYKIELQLKDGQRYTGKPRTIIISDHKEYLMFLPDAVPARELQLNLLELKSMRVLSENARFEFIEFA